MSQIITVPEIGYKITPTLLNSFLYMQGIKRKDFEELKAIKKIEEEKFIKVLNKEFMPSNPAMDKGNEFEALIESRTKDIDAESLTLKHFKDVDRELLMTNVDSLATIVKGGEWQSKVRKIVTSQEDGTSYLLYGKADVIKPSIIYDIKYTQKKKLNKFSSSTQHRLYMYCTGIERFSYLISDGKEWWKEDYYRNAVMDGLFITNIIQELKTWISKREAAVTAFDKHWKVDLYKELEVR